MSLEKNFKKYGHWVAKNPTRLLTILFIITIIFFIQMQNVKTVASDNSDALPKDDPTMASFKKIEEKFGSADTAKIIFEVNYDSKEERIKDLRDPEIIKQMYLLGELAKGVSNVESVSSIAHSIKEVNNDVLPKTRNEIVKIIDKNPQIKSQIDKYYQVTYVTLNLNPDFNEDELFEEMNNLITQLPPINGVDINAGGSVLEGPAVSQTISADMGKTSMYSLLAILIIVILVFRSIKYGLTPIVTIIFGIVWTMGFLGILRMNLSSSSSGVLSMIMGIGIDFGIQIVSRFRQEVHSNSIGDSIGTTLNAVFIPMTTTTIAAVIGFQAMTLGQITFLAEMGQIMSFGVVGCYLAALTLIPPILVLTNKNKKVKNLKAQKA